MGRDAHRERARYGRSHHEAGNPVNVTVRLRRVNAPSKPGEREYWDVLRELQRTGHVRAGFEIAVAQWQAYHARSGTYSAWRRGSVDDLMPLLAPMLAGSRGVHLGWEQRRRRVKLPAQPLPWARPRSIRTGRWVSQAYARRYSHLIFFPPGELVSGYEEVVDYEAEARVDYEP